MTPKVATSSDAGVLRGARVPMGPRPDVLILIRAA